MGWPCVSSHTRSHSVPATDSERLSQQKDLNEPVIAQPVWLIEELGKSVHLKHAAERRADPNPILDVGIRHEAPCMAQLSNDNVIGKCPPCVEQIGSEGARFKRYYGVRFH